jgi:hypothetical protein
MYADDWSANGDVDESLYADAGSNTPTSNPYIISLTNTTGAAISDVSFLNAGNSIGATNSGVTLGVTVSYGISGVTYSNFLYSLLTQPTKIGFTYIESATTSQLTESIRIDTFDVRGKGAYDTYTPALNPFQQQTTVLIMPNQYILNQFTKLTVSSIGAGVTVTFKLYPISVQNSISGIIGKDKNTYAKPQINGTILLNK